jgi:hypothetical protein
MSKKMKLRLEEIKVKSFVTDIDSPGKVRAGGTVGTIGETCDPPTCLPDCLPPTLPTWCNQAGCETRFTVKPMETCYPEGCLHTVGGCLSENVPC